MASKRNADAPAAEPAPDSALPDFEAALAELEALVEQLERGDVSLEHSLRDFERGVQLARGCQTALKNAELKVQQLVEANGQLRLEGFDPAE
ncbi:MAG: exodeoxyribonuclease VII small subunit [Immundisolibacter sp.]|uniref:exodeoxyribonuclease VII small subunit n=1 Tax=Immundisolibacter sp. TaxID=1934948 RepID=UPI003D0EE8D8